MVSTIQGLIILIQLSKLSEAEIDELIQIAERGLEKMNDGVGKVDIERAKKAKGDL